MRCSTFWNILLLCSISLFKVACLAINIASTHLGTGVILLRSQDEV